MARGRSRWQNKALRHQFPLQAERRDSPRFDGSYADADGQTGLRFAEDGTVEFGGEAGRWHIAAGLLTLSTATWQCEGALDLDAAYLLCVPDGSREDRLELQLPFVPD